MAQKVGGSSPLAHPRGRWIDSGMSTKRNRCKGSLSKNREIKVLRRIIDLLSSDLDLNIVFHNVITMMLEYTKADSSFLYILDRRNNELVLVASSNPHPNILRKIKLRMGEGVTGWVAEKKEPVVIPEKAFEDPRFKMFNSLPEDRYEAFVGVPIVLKDQIVGVINFQHKTRKKYTKTTLQALMTIAQLVSGLIQKAWMYEEMKEKTLHLESIFKISKMVISSHSLEEVLSLIVEVICEVMSSPICSIMLLDEKRNVLEVRATHSLDGEYKKRSPVKIGEGITGKVISEKKPVVISNIVEHPDFKMKDIAKKQGLKALVSVPMLVRDKCIGVISVYSQQENAFSSEEVSWLQIIAVQAGIAIEKARLEEDNRTAREALEARKVIEKAKGILMRDLNLSEEVAYRLIHKRSMDTCRPMKEIAEAIILSRGVKLP